MRAQPATHDSTPRGVTVPDIIGMTTIGSLVRGQGDADYDVVSPDGAHVAVVVKRGNVARNTVDYALLVFPTAELLRSPKADTVVQFASSSNRPGIVRVKWLADNTRLAFLGEQPGELPQVYTVDWRTHHLVRHTHATTVITAFDVGATGELVVYAAEATPDTTGYAAMRAHGYVLGPRALVSDVIAGTWGVTAWLGTWPHVLTVVRGETVTTVPLPDSAVGYRGCRIFPGDASYNTVLMVAPTGDVALTRCTPAVAPAAWAGYQDVKFRHYADIGYIDEMYVVIDLATGRAHPLIDAPVMWRDPASWWEPAVWSPTGQSVVLANQMLPLDVPDSAERAARAAHPMVAQVDVKTGAVTVIVPRDSFSVLGWDVGTNVVTLVPGKNFRPEETRRVYFQKRAAGWTAVPVAARSVVSVPALVVDQGLNAPPRLVAIGLRTHTRHVVFDPNPGLLTVYRFAREEVVHWRTKAGAEWAGGLYTPLDYIPGRRYPLVIQTHGFDSTEFWPDGVYHTGEAAQPLAGRGVMVLQIADPRSPERLTPREAPAAEEEIEGAIDHLDSLGLIDRTKVGLEGFSATCTYVLYFLTHSRYPIAAATVADGLDRSYVQHLVFDPTYIGTIRIAEDEKMNGGPPYGPSLVQWLERAPGFNLDRVTAPLRVTALQPASLLGEWEPYAGLLLQGKPTEMVYIPDAAHILVKPWELLTSQQGSLDWFRFWLTGEEDPDPTKAEQYTRWHHLRALRDPNGTRGTASQ